MKKSSLIIGIAVLVLFAVLFAVGGKHQAPATNSTTTIKTDLALSDSHNAVADSGLAIKEDFRQSKESAASEDSTTTNQLVKPFDMA